MRPASASVSAAMIVFAAAPSALQAQTAGSRLAREGENRDGPVVMRLMSECFAARQPETIRRWFQMLPGSREERELLTRNEPELSTCMENDRVITAGKELRFKASLMRRPVAYALARRLIARAPAASPVPVDSEPWFLPQLKKPGAADQVDRASLALMDFGHCIATHQWSGAIALLGAGEGTPEESTAIDQLRPTLGPCLTANVQIKLTPANLREIVAEPDYHILNGEVAPAGAVQ